VSDPAPLRRAAQAVTVVASGILPPLVVLSTPILETPYSGLLLFLALLGSFALAYRWQLLRDTRFLGLWVAVALGIAFIMLRRARSRCRRRIFCLMCGLLCCSFDSCFTSCLLILSCFM